MTGSLSVCSLLPGGANTEVWGARPPEVSIEVSEASLQAFGLTFDDVARAVRSSSVNAGAGAVRTADGNFQLQARNLADTEDKLAFARQYYNDAVATVNRLTTTIPWMFVAGMAGVKQREFYQVPK